MRITEASMASKALFGLFISSMLEMCYLYGSSLLVLDESLVLRLRRMNLSLWSALW